MPDVERALNRADALDTALGLLQGQARPKIAVKDYAQAGEPTVGAMLLEALGPWDPVPETTPRQVHLARQLLLTWNAR
jgi:hypothetical protein